MLNTFSQWLPKAWNQWSSQRKDFLWNIFAGFTLLVFSWVFVFVFLESFCLVAFLCYGKDPVIIHYCSLLWTSRPFYVAECVFPFPIFSHPHVLKLLIWSLLMFPFFLSVIFCVACCGISECKCRTWINLQTFYQFNWQRSVWEIAHMSSCKLTTVFWWKYQLKVTICTYF